jgi:peptide deformylase
MKLTRRVLHLPTKTVDFSKIGTAHRINELIQTMQQFMIDNNAIGLAANQIGLRDRVLVMGIEDQLWGCVNPEIISLDNDCNEFAEGCLSFPGETVTITRPKSVNIRFQTADGQWKEQQLTGLPARCFLHELDHLNGVTMYDRAKEQYATQSRN